MPEDAHDHRLHEVADELYGVAPAEFVQRRDAASRAAKTDGDRALADAIAALRKPTAAAWALNSFVRSDDTWLEPVLDVGARLREAVERGDGPSIRDLMRERARVIADVMSSIGRHAAERGEPMGPAVAAQVERSLRAAMASEDGAVLVRRGILATALEESDVVVPTVAEHRRPVDRPASRTPGSGGRQLAAAERRVAEATGASDRAERELTASTARRVELESEREELRRRLADVEQRLGHERDAEAAAAGRARAARAELRTAKAAARRAADRT